MSRNPARLVGNGLVKLLVPTGNGPYYRIEWEDENGRRRQTTAGTNPAKALAKAIALDEKLAQRAVGPTGRTLGELADEYTSTGRDRKRDRSGDLLFKDWSPTQLTHVRQDLQRAVGPVRDIPAAYLDVETINTMRAACGTLRMVRQVTSVVRNFLRYCEEAGAITPAQALLLPAGARLIQPRTPQPNGRPSRREQVRTQGQSEQYVGEEDCPVTDAVTLFGKTFAEELLTCGLSYGELAVHTAAGTGLRQGEQFQLTAYDIDVHHDEDGDVWYLKVDWQWCTTSPISSHPRRTRPKHQKRREVVIFPLTRSGYQLQAELLKRRDEALAEREAGTNPEALLFPAPEGGMWWSANLTRHIVTAQKAAGWAYEIVAEERTTRRGERKMVQVTQMYQPWHSLRHRFARDMVDWAQMGEGELMSVGGWESIEVVSQRYYRSGAEHAAAARATVRRVASAELA